MRAGRERIDALSLVPKPPGAILGFRSSTVPTRRILWNHPSMGQAEQVQHFVLTRLNVIHARTLSTHHLPTKESSGSSCDA